jgi:hypothetical protein
MNDETMASVNVYYEGREYLHFCPCFNYLHFPLCILCIGCLDRMATSMAVFGLTTEWFKWQAAFFSSLVLAFGLPRFN